MQRMVRGNKNNFLIQVGCDGSDNNGILSVASNKIFYILIHFMGKQISTNTVPVSLPFLFFEITDDTDACLPSLLGNRSLPVRSGGL